MSFSQRISNLRARASHEAAVSYFVASVLVLTAREETGKAAARAVRRVATGRVPFMPAGVRQVAACVDLGLAYAGL